MKIMDAIESVQEEQSCWENFEEEALELEKLLYKKCLKDLKKKDMHILDSGYVFNVWRNGNHNETGFDFNGQIAMLLEEAYKNMKPHMVGDLIKQNASVSEIAEFYYESDNMSGYEFVRDSMSCMYNSLIDVLDLFDYKPDTSLEIVQTSDNDLWDQFFENAVDDFIDLFDKHLKLLAKSCIKKTDSEL